MASVQQSGNRATNGSQLVTDLNSGKRLRVGTWNLDRDKPPWRQPFQADHISEEADLWLLTEVPVAWQRVTAKVTFSGTRPAEKGQYWSAIISKWPLERIPAKHPALAMAHVDHPDGAFLAASSVFPWRGAAKFWPSGDGDTFAERCVCTLVKHTDEIVAAQGDLPVVWGGDFNQALSGHDYVGSDVGRRALRDAFEDLGLRAVTIEAAGQEPPQRSIDHIAIPEEWSLRAMNVQRPESDGRLLSDHPSYVVSVDRA